MKIALAQCEVAFGDPAANVEAAASWIKRAGNADLVVFPECFLTGYCVDSMEQAQAISLDCEAGHDHLVSRCDPSIGAMATLARESGKHLVFGFAGRDSAGLYNGAALALPDGSLRLYKKTHLPCLGLDRFVTVGDDLPVFDTAVGKIGILICFDIRIPEAARTLALKGAELILLPTNWPTGASSTLIVPARAAENTVYVAACNRVGTENGVGFIGQSVIVDPSGKVLAHAEAEETLLTAELDLDRARNKTVVVQPHGYTIDAFASRQPQLYEVITQPKRCISE